MVRFSSLVARRSPLALALVVALGLATPVLAQRGGEIQKNSPRVLAAFKEVLAAPGKSVVQVLAEGKQVALGTIVSADGWIVTKASLLPEKPLSVKLLDGRSFSARVTGVEEKFDLGMLKIAASGLTPVTFADSKGTPVGYWVASVGMNGEPVAVGVVSVAARDIPSREYPRSINTNSGYLGVGLADDSEEGAKLGQIMPNSAASKAGLKENDVILSVGAVKIKNGEALIATLSKFKPNDTVTLKIRRGEEELELKAILGKRPQQGADRSDFQNRMGSELSERRTGFPHILQHDTVISPRDCGCPLVNLEGKVIGINIARAGRTESYAIPGEKVLALLGELKSGKLAPVVKAPVEPEAVTAARVALKKAEEDLAAAQKKVEALKAALKKVEEEAKKNK